MDSTKQAVVLGLLLSSMPIAQAQDYPKQSIRILTGSAGGIGDFSSRVVGQGISGPLGQPVVVDNRGDVSGELVARAAPDGYTLLVDGSSFWIGPLFRDTPYDVIKDFLPVVTMVSAPNVVVVHPSVQANSIKDLIALAKAKPGALNYGSGGVGSSLHLAAELFKLMAGVNIVRVNYKGAGPALNGLIAGEVQLSFLNAATATPLMKSGKVKALAVAAPKPSALVPDLPTVSASGLPGFEVVSMSAMFAPAKTPTAIVSRLNQEVVRVLARPDVKEKFFGVGVEVVGGAPDHLLGIVKSDLVVWGKVIKEANIRQE